MCEKPMAINGEEAQKMLDAAERTGKKLSIGYQNRYRPDSWYLKRACEADELGEIYYAKAHAVRRRGVPTWGVFIDEHEQGGGPLIDIGTHAPRPHTLDDGQLQAEAGCRQCIQEAGWPEGMRQYVGRLGRGEDHG